MNADLEAHRAAWLAELGRLAAFPPRLYDTPLIIDLAIVGNPAAAVALAVAALRVPTLALVVANNDDSQSAGLARRLLTLCGRPDVPVVPGPGHHHGYLCGPSPHPTSTPPVELHSAIDATHLTATGQPARWLLLGAESNLAAVLAARPSLAQQLHVWWMPGPRPHPDPDPAKHLAAVDLPAVMAVLSALPRLWLITTHADADTAIQITPDSAIHQRLTADAAPWARLLAQQFDLWFAGHNQGSPLYEPLALAAVLGKPFVTYDHTQLPRRLTPQPNVIDVFTSRGANHTAFMGWLGTQLAAPAAVAPGQPTHRQSPSIPNPARETLR
jgi:inosine-uridine nucleoside N-ribohydrolase